MASTSYRLGEWKIMESLGGGLAWEAHHGFGGYRQGKCFLKGRILFLLPHENQELGFLKGEFLDSIAKLPAWEQSDSYCPHPKIFLCASGAVVGEGEMRAWHAATLAGRSGERRPVLPPALAEGGFRLGKLMLTVHEGMVACRRRNRAGCLETTEVSLREDIMFISPGFAAGEDPAPPDWETGLADLPPWNLTTYYSMAAIPAPLPGGQAPPPPKPGRAPRAQAPVPPGGAVWPPLGDWTQGVRDYLQSDEFARRKRQLARAGRVAGKLAARAGNAAWRLALAGGAALREKLAERRRP